MATVGVENTTDPIVRFYAAGYAVRGGEPWHHHDGWHQLIHTARGVLTVHVERAVWVVPPTRAIWIPAGTPHRLVASTQTLLQTIYLDAHAEFDAGGGLLTLDVVDVDALGRELIAEIGRRGPVHTGAVAERRLVEVLLDHLQRRPVPGTQLPDPIDQRAYDAARLIRRDPSRSIDSVVAEVGASRRTLERAFSAEVSIPLGRWQHRARMLRALELLADRRTVTETALAVGFSTTSAFVAAFRRDFGETPSRYFR